ncbi:alkane 1-monooxygenase [Palleronia sediminis]|uniref:Alkane 1-monooxygenase n=1 Tax=Palleronia sediminis TaxID=2547833 RepID=A0A4R6AF53_9RHOB|nr:alkane 1-monooxygenase [Palleronia sediminis]TDL79833.1 alkane 1-monooxygenase [Palleronia sediminis]
MRWTFAIATLLPVLPMALGLWGGGAWVVVAILSMTALVMGLDSLVRVTIPPDADGVEFPAGPLLSIVIGLSQIGLLAGFAASVGAGRLPLVESLGLLYALGLWLGQVGNANAHELIHRPARGLRRFGALLFTAILYGHHASAHPRVHHRHVATPRDPATARLGESFWAYAPRCWIDGFRAGHAAEAGLLRSRYGAGWRRHDPFIAYVGGALAILAGLAALGGPSMAAWYLGLCLFAQMQLMLSDYVQHYGLTRAIGPGGRPEPVGPRHSWNAPHWYSGAMMLNAPRHSDHHAHPARPFNTLALPDPADAPRLPRSLPVMATLALFPTAWRRVMDRRARRWAAPGDGTAAKRPAPAPRDAGAASGQTGAVVAD